MHYYLDGTHRKRWWERENIFVYYLRDLHPSVAYVIMIIICMYRTRRAKRIGSGPRTLLMMSPGTRVRAPDVVNKNVPANAFWFPAKMRDLLSLGPRAASVSPTGPESSSDRRRRHRHQRLRKREICRTPVPNHPEKLCLPPQRV